MIQRVNIGGPAHLYTHAIPSQMMVIGTVTRKSGEVGALVRSPGGAYAQLNGRVLQPLNRRDVICAMTHARIHEMTQSGNSNR